MEDLFSPSHALKQEVQNTVDELLKCYDVIERTDSDVVFSEDGHRFCIEINIFEKQAVVETFYLQRDPQIHKQYDKTKIEAATISGSVDENGQVYLQHGLSGIKHTTSAFNKSYLKFYLKAVGDCAVEMEGRL